MIDPKPTWYKRVRFRSRLESRWAIFLDISGSLWQYEKIEFKIKSRGWAYIPDFYVHNDKAQFYIEVKPADPSDDYLQWIANFRLDLPLIFAVGSFYKHRFPKLYQFSSGSLSQLTYPSLFTNSRAGILTACKWRFDLR